MGQGAGTQPAPGTKAKHLLCAFESGWPGCLTPGNIFPFTLHCLVASITFLTQSPAMGIADTPEILRAVTHLSFQPPHPANRAAHGWSSRGRASAPPQAGPASSGLRTGVRVGPTGVSTECISKSGRPKRMRKKDRI